MRFKFILAGLEILARLEHEHATDEQPRLIDDAFAREDIGDIAHSGPARNIDDPVGGERAGCLEALFAEEQRDTRRQGNKNKSTDDGIADDRAAVQAGCRPRAKSAKRNAWGFSRRCYFGFR